MTDLSQELQEIRPDIDSNGVLTNPIGSKPWIHLDDKTPLSFQNLKPNATYRTRSLEYLTGHKATTYRIRGGLQIVASPTRHKYAQQTAGRAATSTLDRLHGGHIIAVSLGGFASGPNLMPQCANFNLSAYARVERGWRAALREGCTVEVDLLLTDDEEQDSWAPFMIVRYWEDGEYWGDLVMLNEPHAQ